MSKRINIPVKKEPKKDLDGNFKGSYGLFGIFFPKAIGIAFKGNDLMVTMVCKKALNTERKIIKVDNFLTKDLKECQLEISAFKQLLNEVVLSIPRQKVLVREICYPGADLMELKEALKYQIDSFFPFRPDEAYYDVYKVSNDEQNRKMLIIAIKKDDVDEVVAKLEAIGIVPTKVIITPISLTTIIGDKKGKLVTVHKWENNYCYNTFFDGLFDSTLVIDEKDAILEKIRFDMPDEILESDRLFLGEHDTTGIINNKDTDNREDVDGEITSNYKTIPISRIDDNQESFGAALYGIKDAGDRFSLFNTGKKGIHIQRLLMFGLLGFLILILFLMPQIIKNRKMDALNMVNNRIKTLKNDIFRIEDIQSRLTEMEETLISVGKIRAEHVPRVKVLLELSEKLPRNAWIKELYIYRNNFEIGGIAKTATDLIHILENSTLFSNIGFTAPVINTEEGKESFRLRGKINAALNEDS